MTNFKIEITEADICSNLFEPAACIRFTLSLLDRTLYLTELLNVEEPSGCTTIKLMDSHLELEFGFLLNDNNIDVSELQQQLAEVWSEHELNTTELACEILANQIKKWDKNCIAELSDYLITLRKLCSEIEADVEEYVEMSLLPSVTIPNDVDTSFPVWAMDSGDRLLVGDDEIISLDEYYDYYA